MLQLIALAAAAISSVASVTAAPAAPSPLIQVTWVATPSGADIAAVYPSSAVAAGKGGAVLLECRVDTQGALDACKVQIEDPVGMEFGIAAMQLASRFKMAQTAPDGSSVVGRTVRIPIMFQISTGD